MNNISKTLIRKIGHNIKNNIVSEEELNTFNEYRNTYIEVMEELLTSIKDKLSVQYTNISYICIC